MKILIAGINYAPDLVGIAKYTTEMCQFLRARGHEVVVVTAPPYYPAWKIVRPYKGFVYSSEMHEGIRVVRCPMFVPASPSAVLRILHHLTFALTCLPVMLFEAIRYRPDVVLSIAPSLLTTPVAVAAARLCGARTWLHIQDFEVDAAFNMHFVKGRGLRRAALWLERSLLRSVDVVSAISAKMVDMLREKGVPRARVMELRNWVDTDGVANIVDGDAESRAMARANSPLGGRFADSIGTIALYSGSMGAKQGLDVVAAAARALSVDRPDIGFVFCGRGAARAQLEAMTADLRNVIVLDLQSAEHFRLLIAAADIHLLPQCAEIQDLALPSKIGAMLASGRPVIGMATPGTQVAAELSDCGIVIPPADVSALTEALCRLADDAPMRRQLGANGRLRAADRWDRNMVLLQLESRLLDLCETPPRGRTEVMTPSTATAASEKVSAS